MPITIVADAGDAAANSFVTADEMTAYCAARLNASVWTASDAQLPALVEATRDLTLLAYVGGKASVDQALAWPRVWAADPDASTAYLDADSVVRVGDTEVVYFDTDTIPSRVKDATCELALAYLKAGTSDLAAADSTQGVIRKRIDVIETEWAPNQRATGLARFPRVMAYLEPLLDAAQASGGLEIVRT